MRGVMVRRAEERETHRRRRKHSSRRRRNVGRLSVSLQSSEAPLSLSTEQIQTPLPAVRASGAPGAAATSRWRAAGPRTTASKPLSSPVPRPRPTSTLEQEEQASVLKPVLLVTLFAFRAPAANGPRDLRPPSLVRWRKWTRAQP